MDVCTVGNLALKLRECCAGIFLGSVATTQLFSLPVNDAGVDGQLISDQRLAAGAAGELNASDLRWKLAALSHLRDAS